MENNLKYIVYITTNLKNNKIYVGVHGTRTPYEFDGYLGNGIYAHQPSTYQHGKYPLHKAVHKYGPKNFRRATLKVYDTVEDALHLEELIVDKEFLKRDDVYNVVEGGGYPADCSIETYQYALNGDFIKS